MVPQTALQIQENSGDTLFFKQTNTSSFLLCHRTQNIPARLTLSDFIVTVWVLLSLSVDNNLVITWICWWICIAKPPNSQSSLPLWPLYTAVEYPGGFILDSLSIFTQTDELKICLFGEDCFKMKYVIVAVAWMERGGLSANLSLSAGRE